MTHIVGHYINGEIVKTVGTRTSNVHNPATGEIVGTVPLATPREVESVIDVASAACSLWSATPPLRRARILNRFRELVERDADKLANIVSREHGKTHDDALGEVTRGLEVVEFACGGPHLLKGEFSENVGRQIDSHSLRQPLGVVVGISPFNFPVMVPCWMFPVALACGNTFIMKPSEKDPSASVFMAELLTEAGLPDGVFNVVQGDKEAVDALLSHRNVKAISFVGSTPIAKYIYAAGAAQGKRVQALGGAKNHMVIMPDADLNVAADALIGAAYGSAGERCMAISVAVPVSDAVADALVEKLVHRIDSLVVGPSTDPKTNMGPLISRQHLETVCEYIQLGVDEGAILVVDGRKHHCTRLGGGRGFFLGPTLFDQVTSAMRIHKEEIFGPVLGIVRASSYEAAVRIVDEHEYGNGAAIFTQDGHLARSFAADVQAGMVGVNVAIPVPMAFHSFGGWKNSLFGGVHIHGLEGVRFNTKLKTITTRWRAHADNGTSAEFVMPTMT